MKQNYKYNYQMLNIKYLINNIKFIKKDMNKDIINQNF